jgi:hypothetical protein
MLATEYLGTLDPAGELVGSDAPPSEAIAAAERHRTGLLVTFPNVRPVGFTRALIDPFRTGARWIGRTASPVLGTDGLRPFENGFVCVDQTGIDGATGLAFLAPDLTIRASVPLPTVRDGHDVLPWQGGVLIADTGGNRILLVDALGNELSQFWVVPDAGNAQHHVNSLAVLDGEVFATAFGEWVGSDRRCAREGYVVNVASSDLIAHGLYQPHSLIAADHTLWWLESGKARIWRHDLVKGPEVFATLTGYLRGLHVDAEWIFAAASARRRTSKHTGLAVPVEQHDPNAESCRLFCIHRATRAVFSRLLTALGREVFALAGVPNGAPSAAEFIVAVDQRIAALEDETRPMPGVKDPAMSTALRSLIAKALEQADNVFGARDALRVLTEAYPTDPWINFYAGFTELFPGGNRSAARRMLELALSSGVVPEMTLCHLADLDVAEGATAAAKEKLLRALSLAPDYAPALDRLSNLQ